MNDPVTDKPRTAAEVLATSRQPSFSVQVSSLVLPLWRTLGYMSPPARERRAARYARHDVPLPGWSPVVAGHVFADELCLAAFKLLRKPPTVDAFTRIEQEVDEALALFDARGWLGDVASYIGDPPPLVEVKPFAAHGFRLRLEGFSFDSGWEPHPGEPGRERWLSYAANRTARMFVLRHSDRPRPWLVYLHGTGMGRPEIDSWVLRVKHLHKTLGLNVVMPVLPLHGARSAPRRVDAQFPTVDVLDNIHGLAQAAWDTRRVLSWVRAQQPTAVGITGLSLGGYTAALVAGVEPPFDCVLAGMPAVDFPRILRRHTPREVRELEDFRVLDEKSDRLHRAVSPLLPTPATPRERRFIYAGTADRLLDPLEQIVALWQHWERPEIAWVHASHVGHLFHDAGARHFIDETLRRTLPLA